MQIETEWLLEEAIVGIQQKWGVRALQKAPYAKPDVPPISTGYRSLDRVLGGGVPEGAITEFTGFATSGIYTVALRALACSQETEKSGGYIDTVGAFDPDYVAHCEVDLSKLLLVRPRNITEAIEIALDLIRNRIGMLVWDSTTPFITKHQDRQLLARAFKQFRMLAATTGTVLLFLNPLNSPDVREPITSDIALRVHFRRTSWLYERGTLSGYQVQATVLKSRFVPVGARTELAISLPI